mmetsp:Transcript_10882/g.21676  ORF Transcript_10882/g.21676 Transcript_10882/m.21676 type:complete len:113 (+) Transcript_10882:244-582(+)
MYTGSCMLRIKSSITVEATGSNPAVGSSYMIICSTFVLVDELSVTMARASATRFFIPPESSAGYRFSTPLSPTFDKLSATALLISSSCIFVCSYSINPTFCLTLRESNKAPL